MNFDVFRSPPHDRSIFRKNIGRALLNRENDRYLDVWEKDLMSKENREKYRHLRDIAKEKQVESAVTDILRQKFMFRFLALEGEALRMGQDGLREAASVQENSISFPLSPDLTRKAQIIARLQEITDNKPRKKAKSLPTNNLAKNPPNNSSDLDNLSNQLDSASVNLRDLSKALSESGAISQ